jgi:hypothetical protein
LKQIALGMSSYHNAMNCLPLGTKLWLGDPLPPGPGSWYDDHGWYGGTLLFIDQKAIYDSINFNWQFSGPVNSTSRMTKIATYGCPTNGLQTEEWTSKNCARVRGNYVVNFGNTDFGQNTKDGVPFGRAPFTRKVGVRFAEITDGLSQTLMLSEIITPEDYPGWDGPFGEIEIAVGGQAFEAWRPPNSPVFDDVARQCPPPEGLNGIPGCNLLGLDGDQYTPLQVLSSRSKHVGGVHSAFCDGSVRFIKSSIDPATWRALSTSRGREVVSADQF